MADTKISALSAASAGLLTHEFGVNEGGASKKVTGTQMRAVINGNDSWEGNIISCFGDGDPTEAMLQLSRAGNVSPTPTNIGTAVARISYFRPKTTIVVNKVRYFGVGATTNVYRIAIYNADTLARVLTETAFTTSAAAWGAIGSSLALTLTAGQLYFLAVSVNATGTTAGVLALGGTVAATTGQIAVLPKSFPGNIAVSAGFQACGLAQGAVTTGALPDPFPTVATQAAWTGGMPCFFLDNSNA